MQDKSTQAYPAAPNHGATEPVLRREEVRAMSFDDILAMRSRRLALESQRDALDHKIAQVKAEVALAREPTLQRILDAMDECGITSRDILALRPLPIVFAPMKPRVKAARYFDPNSDKTWNGRGLKPHWYQSHLKNGGTAEDLTVKRFDSKK